MSKCSVGAVTASDSSMFLFRIIIIYYSLNCRIYYILYTHKTFIYKLLIAARFQNTLKTVGTITVCPSKRFVASVECTCRNCLLSESPSGIPSMLAGDNHKNNTVQNETLVLVQTGPRYAREKAQMRGLAASMLTMLTLLAAATSGILARESRDE